VVTDAGGAAKFRGFLGDYKITISAASKSPVTQAMQLSMGRPNRLTVKLP
jgi:hypothetical protein